ncbi:MAG: hypothetical protein AW07_02876 [Candidatus Accumulibacter sp. SK-11]|nr:MAG: hypothetical protein AW07_02876 [Candidatus Accumulibacter sp. SK-11]
MFIIGQAARCLFVNIGHRHRSARRAQRLGTFRDPCPDRPLVRPVADAFGERRADRGDFRRASTRGLTVGRGVEGCALLAPPTLLDARDRNVQDRLGRNQKADVEHPVLPATDQFLALEQKRRHASVVRDDDGVNPAVNALLGNPQQGTRERFIERQVSDRGRGRPDQRIHLEPAAGRRFANPKFGKALGYPVHLYSPGKGRDLAPSSEKTARTAGLRHFLAGPSPARVGGKFASRWRDFQFNAAPGNARSAAPGCRRGRLCGRD